MLLLSIHVQGNTLIMNMNMNTIERKRQQHQIRKNTTSIVQMNMLSMNQMTKTWRAKEMPHKNKRMMM